MAEARDLGSGAQGMHALITEAAAAAGRQTKYSRCASAPKRTAHFHSRRPLLQMFFDDDLPVWGFVGKVEHSHPHGLRDGIKGETRTFLFTHFHFDIAYNEDQVCVA
jgi:hypothetical protein